MIDVKKGFFDDDYNILKLFLRIEGFIFGFLALPVYFLFVTGQHVNISVTWIVLSMIYTIIPYKIVKKLDKRFKY